MTPLFCTNFDYKTRLPDLSQLFSRYGYINRFDINSDKGYAFVYFEKERHASDAMHALDGKPFGRDGRSLSVEWGWHVDDKASGQRPSKTLFVVHFDPVDTTERDLRRHFGAYGRVLEVSIRRNYALVQFETQEGATRALGHTHMGKFLGSVIMVSYSNDDERRGGYDSPRRDDERRGSISSRRSPSLRYRQSRLSSEYVKQQRPVNDRYKDNDPSARGGDDERRGRYDSPRRDYGRPSGSIPLRRSPSPRYRQSRLSRQQRPVNDRYKDIGPSALRGGDDERRGRYDSPRRDYGRPYGSSRRSPSPGYRQSGLSPGNLRHQWPVNDRYKGNDPSALQGSDDERRGRHDSPRRDDGRPSEYGSSRRSPSPGYRQIRLSPDNMRQQQRPVNDRYKDSGPSYARDMSPYHGREQSQSPVRR